MKPLCIYHGKCADGFTAAWAVRQFFGDDVEFHAGIYGEAPPDVTGRDVLLVDFSYKRAMLVAMATSARSILVLDHHKTAQEDLAGFPTASSWSEHLREAYSPANLHVVFDMERSGAGLAWDFFMNAARPALVNYVEDRDLWRFKLPNSRAVNAYIFSFEYYFDIWDQLGHDLNFVDTMVIAEQSGEAIERKHHKDVAELVAVCKRRIRIGGIEVWGASIPYTLTSDAGNLMAQGEPFAACYWDTPKGRVFSLRSTEGGVDVSIVAKDYGGGGHKHASGFTVPFDQLSQFELDS